MTNIWGLEKKIKELNREIQQLHRKRQEWLVKKLERRKDYLKWKIEEIRKERRIKHGNI